ncbi:Amiloride-sensitive sodium channel subunit alpha, partial [Frankliniella fusca]
MGVAKLSVVWKQLDQSDFIRFPKYFGRQCSANAVAAVCKAHVLNPNLWTSMNVDECLMAGNKLFELSYELLPSTYRNIIYLRPVELHSYVIFPENEIKIEVQVNDEYYGTSMNNIATVNHGIVITIKYERTDEISNRYKTNAEVRETKRKQQSDKIKEKYHGDETFQKSHSSNMREKYQTNVEYHNNRLQNTKKSYQTLQGAKRKSNYQNQYHSSKKTKICLHKRFNEQKREMPTVICTCCAQLFFKKSTVNELGLKIHQTLSVADVCTYRHHLGENESGNVCSTCANHLKKGKVPHFAAKNGLVFDPLPQELTGLTTLEERLVSARIPFMQIRELGYQRQLGLKGNCVNVPIDINKTVTCLPRMDSEYDTLLVQLMRRMTDEIDELMDQQETLLTSGFVADSGVKIAPGEGNMPLSLTLDEDMDVLAFPTVYGGKQRIFKVKYTPVEMAKAEARHHDRRVAINIPKVMMNFCK